MRPTMIVGSPPALLHLHFPPPQELRCNRHLAGGWQHLHCLTRLTRLDLARSRLDPAALVTLLGSLPRMQSFSAANCRARLPASLADTLAALPLGIVNVAGNTLLQGPQGAGTWTALAEVVKQRRAGAPATPMRITEQPPGLPGLEASIATFEWEQEDEAMAAGMDEFF